MKKIVRNEGEMIEVKKKGKILRGKHEGRVLWYSKIFKNLTGKKMSGKMILGKKWQPCEPSDWLTSKVSDLLDFFGAKRILQKLPCSRKF